MEVVGPPNRLVCFRVPEDCSNSQEGRFFVSQGYLRQAKEVENPKGR